MAGLSTTTERRATTQPATRLWGRVAWIGGALGVAALFLWLTVQCRPFTIDDAFISIRYAENLVRGDGLVFNPGERVEGYTNFLWVLILAAVHALGGESLAGAKLLSTAANVGTLGLVTWAAARWWPRPALPGLALLPALLLAANFGFVLWGVGGLETALFTALVTAGLLCLVWEASDTPDFGIWNLEFGILSRRWSGKAQIASQGQQSADQSVPLQNPKSKFQNRAALLFALATLARPDGAVLFAGGMLGWGLWALASRRLSGALVRRWLAGGLLYGAIVGAHYLFRYLYYGDWVPNTAYIKVPQEGFVVHWQALVTWLRPWGLVDPSNLAPLGPLLAGLPDWWTWAVSLLATPTVLLVLVGLGAGRRHAWTWVLGAAGAVWLIYLARV
jgi:arabinofuranosyltransferase